MTDQDPWDKVPAEVQERALRHVLTVWDTILEPYGLDVCDRMDLLEHCLEEDFERAGAGMPPEPLI